MEQEKYHLIFSYVSPLSSIEMPVDLPLETIKAHLNEVYNSIYRQIREEELFDKYLHEFS